MNPRQQIHNHYAPRVNSNEPGWKILDWASEDAQRKRFEALIRFLERSTGISACGHHDQPTGRNACAPFENFLDVGCGTADLLPFLQRHFPLVRYTGVDLLPEIVAEAKRRHPGAEVAAANVFEDKIFAPRSFDVVFCSGVFNLELGNNEAFLARALPVLWELANHALVVNLLHERAANKFSTCHYFSPRGVMALCEKLTPNTTLDESYLENDFTVALRRA